MVAKKITDKRAPRQNDERVDRSRKLVLSATYELLTKAGFGGVSVDEVSRRSGVAKTTIYRHWPSRTALLLEACRELSVKPQPPDTGTLRGDLELLAVGVANRLRLPWSTVLPSVIDAGERDKAIAQLHAQIHAQMRSAFTTVLERGQNRGEISSDHDPSEIVAAILGSLFYRRWFSHEPLDEAFAKRVVGRALGQMGN